MAWRATPPCCPLSELLLLSARPKLTPGASEPSPPMPARAASHQETHAMHRCLETYTQFTDLTHTPPSHSHGGRPHS